MELLRLSSLRPKQQRTRANLFLSRSRVVCEVFRPLSSSHPSWVALSVGGALTSQTTARKHRITMAPACHNPPIDSQSATPTNKLYKNYSQKSWKEAMIISRGMYTRTDGVNWLNPLLSQAMRHYDTGCTKRLVRGFCNKTKTKNCPFLCYTVKGRCNPFLAHSTTHKECSKGQGSWRSPVAGLNLLSLSSLDWA